MYLFHFKKSFSTIATTLSLITISNFLAIDSARAFSVTFGNGDFESPIAGSQNNWNTIGDVTTTDAINGINPTLIKQAIMTTGYIQDNYDNPVGNRNDDSGNTFNQTTNTNPVSADVNFDGDTLQESIGIQNNALSVPRVGALDGFGTRTSKEGSAIYQEFEVTLTGDETNFQVSFDWAYLTNDEKDSVFGEQDFAFWSLSEVNETNYTTVFDSTDSPTNEIDVLKSSSSDISVAPGGSNNYGEAFDYVNQTYSVNGLTAGTYTYRIGFGVVDVDGLDETSALLLDNVRVTPFEFTPSIGIGVVLSLIGIGKLHRRVKNFFL